MANRYEKIKKTFIDSNNTPYIKLDSISNAYEILEDSISKPMKMILLFGKPGTGKSMLLKTIYENLKDKKEICYFNAPIFNEKSFLKKIYEFISKTTISNNLKINFDGLLYFVQNMKGKRDLIFLLDECQLYSTLLMERIRLLSDTGVIKFVITLHKTDQEDLIVKKHFKTRIWEVIELKNATENDLYKYVVSKFSNIKENNMIQRKDIKFIYQYTEGNFRETNKFLYTMFNIYQYYDIHKPGKFNFNNLSKKILEMTAIKLGYLND